MKVLHVICGLDRLTGGPAVAVEQLAMAQQRAGLSVWVFSTNWEGHSSDEAARRVALLGIEVHQVGPCKRPFARNPQIRPTLQALIPQFDIVHIHGLWEEVQHHAAAIAYRHRIPFVISPHGMLDRWSMRTSSLAKRLYLAARMGRHLRRAAAIHHITEWEQGQAEHLRIPTRRIVQPIGLDLSEFRDLPPTGFLRTRLGIPADRPLVVFLGRVYSGKGVEYLIPALPLLASNADLCIVGPDQDGFAQKMQALAQSLNLGRRVHFAGMMHGAQRIACLVDADLFALPSDHENFSIATAEAMAAAKPVVVSDQVGLGPLIDSNGVGSAVPINPTAIARALDQWLLDTPKSLAAGQKARQLAFSLFDWDVIAQNWVRIYTDLAANPHP